MSRDDPDTRTRILRATWDLLEERRGQGVRMSDIARQAGISRQALYLHFPTRAELLIATTHYLDDVKGTEERLAPSRAAETGIERLDAFIEAWAAYMPEIYGLAKAFLAMRETDAAAATAWDQRMQDMREGCEAAIAALKRDRMLSTAYAPKQATDILWTLLSIRNWEQWTLHCGWSQKRYLTTVKSMAHRLLVADGAPN